MNRNLEELGRRERKRIQTRDSMQRSAIALFEQHGFDAVRVEDISEHADVSTRTFFRYFSGKAEVLLSDKDRRIEQIRSIMAARPVGEPVFASVEAVVRGFLGDVPSERHLFEAQVQNAAASSQMLGCIRLREFELSREIGAFVNERVTDSHNGMLGSVVGAATMAAIVVAIVDWTLDPEMATPEADGAVATLRAALAPLV